MNIKVYVLIFLSFFGSLSLEGRAESKSVVSTNVGLDAEITSYKEARAQAKRRAYMAQQEADRLLTHDWLGYRTALKRQEYYQAQVEALDVKIYELELKKKQAE